MMNGKAALGRWRPNTWLQLIESLNRKSADVAEQANVAVFLAALAAAEVEDAEAADGEVVADGIAGVEPGQAIGDGASGPPVGALPLRESEERGNAVDVGVERDDQLRRIGEIPDAE